MGSGRKHEGSGGNKLDCTFEVSPSSKTPRPESESGKSNPYIAGNFHRNNKPDASLPAFKEWRTCIKLSLKKREPGPVELCIKLPKMLGI